MERGSTQQATPRTSREQEEPREKEERKYASPPTIQHEQQQGWRVDGARFGR